MNRRRRPRRSPAWPVIMGLVLALGATPFAGLTGTGPTPGTVIAADPTPDPSSLPSGDPIASVDPTLPPNPVPTPDPTVAPTEPPAPTDTPAPTANPTASPPSSPEPTPAPTPDATPDPTPAAPATPEPSASAVPSPTADASPVPIFYALSPGQQVGGLVGPAIPIYKLVTAGIDPGANSPHGASSLTGTDCAACHAAHTARQADLLSAPTSQATVCYACHAAGQGARDVKSQFTGPLAAPFPANDASTDDFYSHPLAGTAALPTVTCSDCHNPHLSGTARPVESTTGWTAGGTIATATGVSVVNAVAGSAPRYTGIDGGVLTYEYELCLKCHSGAATLPARSGAHPSWWSLDAGIEFNPANASVHPIEAAGRNATAQMAASLAGGSPFKAWTFGVDSTIRCTNCHGDPSTVDQTGSASPKTPAADAQEASHGSPNRGLLTAPYRDRTLKPTGEAYQAENFALCYLCHAERPFVDPNVDPSAPDTAFPLHGRHLAGDLARNTPGEAGAGLSIDAAGDGQGLAVCSECHFRSHSTAIAYRPGDTSPIARADGNTGLVAFAPDIRPVGGIEAWTRPDGSGQGSCTLTCHGYTHTAAQTYSVAPATGFRASATNGPVGVTITFTDATQYVTDAGAEWLWTFGDGGTSTSRNPSHVYAAEGSWTVSLTVTRTADGLATTMTRTAYITVTP